MTPARRALATLLALAVGTACNGSESAGPDPIPPRQFNLQLMDNGSLPAFIWQDVEFGGEWHLQAATLIPFAVGRTIDQRLVSDRTGRGGTGGNTRDTTVARGQFMDIRILRQVVKDAAGLPLDVVFRKDSTLVDAEVRDTILVIRRAFPNKTLSAIDTGYFVEDRLVMFTTLDYLAAFRIPRRKILLTYQLSR